MEKLYTVANKLEETSNGLLNDIRSRSSLNRMYEKQSLALKKKLVEERKKAYDAASRKEGEGKGGLGILRDLFLLRFLRGRGGGGPRRGGGGDRVPPIVPTGGGLGVGPKITPRNNIVPFSRGRAPTRLGGLSRVGPLAALGTGLDFTRRLGSGQNVLEASLGSGGGLAGALAGGAKGAALGSVAGPVGSLIGGIGGSILGGIAGSSIADFLSGANRRRGQELERVTLMSKKTEFSKASDDFDVVLDNFEGNTAPLLKSVKRGTEEKVPSIEGGGLFPTTPKTPFWTAGRIFDIALLGAELLLLIGAVISPFEGVAADAGAGILVTRRLAKLGLLKLIKRLNPLKLIKRLNPLNWFKKSPVKSPLIKRRIKTPNTPLEIFRKKKIKKTRVYTPVARNNSLVRNSLSKPIKTYTRPSTSAVNPSRNITTNRQAQDTVLQNILKRKDPWDITGAKQPKDLVTQNYRKLLERPSTMNDGDFVKITRSFRGFGKSYPFLQKWRDITGVSLQGLQTSVGKTVNRAAKIFMGDGKVSVTNRGSNRSIGAMKAGRRVPTVTKSSSSKQEGGRVEAGRPYIVGEIGKELFVPDASGEIIPNEDLPSSNLLVIDREPERIIIPQIVQGNSDIVPISSAPNPYDVVAKYAQMTGLFTV